MANVVLSGEQFKILLKSGAQFLLNDIDHINELNVFPVPDGDTGTNMCLTIQGGIKDILNSKEDHIGLMFKSLTKAMIKSARGNSGVILSQYFKGMANYLIDKNQMTTDDLIHAFESAYLRAYKVVQNPTEGTMLTVMKEAAEYLKLHAPYECIDDLLLDYVKAAQESLNNTPNLLPVLKEAGVVDSGGAGFLLIIEGMLMALNGTIVQYEDFVIEKEDIDEEEKLVVKKHAIVAVSPGDGISEMFKMMECDVIVSGGQTMNPSSDDFIKAFKKIKADYIYVFPNNKNIILAAKQAAMVYQEAQIIVIPTTSVGQCYSGLSTYDCSLESSKDIEEHFISAIDNVVSASVTYAIRSTNIEGININKGDYMTIIDKKIVSSVESKIEAAINIVKYIDDIDERFVITLMYGKDMTDSQRQEVYQQIKLLKPHLEIIEVDGKQDVYSLLVAVE